MLSVSEGSLELPLTRGNCNPNLTPPVYLIRTGTETPAVMDKDEAKDRKKKEEYEKMVERITPSLMQELFTGKPPGDR